MSAPRISVLLPCLNARPYLEPRIDSLLKQTDSNWEAIVLDSCSTDGSWEFFKLIASADPRFRLYQIPREGFYAALNRGLELATGEFLHIATCDDTMFPEFLTKMVGALNQCAEAGIAACDAMLINRSGDELLARDMSDQLSARAIKVLLSSGSVPSAFPGDGHGDINYRPAPHDCLLHFTARSVYFSLTQLVVRTAVARTAGPFETTVGSVADFGWLLRLTSLTGSVHLPQKLATWRFHGDQLSVRRDSSRRSSVRMMCERAIPEIHERHHPPLTRTECAALLALCNTRLAPSAIRRFGSWWEVVLRLLWMSLERPSATLRMFRRAHSRLTGPREYLLSMIFQRLGLAPKALAHWQSP